MSSHSSSHPFAAAADSGSHSGSFSLDSIPPHSSRSGRERFSIPADPEQVSPPLTGRT
jgi:hypothetical protein